MKIIYTILFFIDTLLLISLSFLLFKMIDAGIGVWKMFFVISAILVSIISLVILFRRYLKIPPPGDHT